MQAKNKRDKHILFQLSHLSLVTLTAELEPLQVGDLLQYLHEDDEGQNVLSRKQKYRECCPSIRSC